MLARSVLALSAGLLLLLPAPASAAITLTEGADTVSTSKFELNFDDGAGNVERLTNLQWRNGAGTLSSDLANEGGNGGAPCTGATEFWGESYATQDFAPPGPVVAGTTGTWVAPGGRTVEINGSAPTACSGADPIVPVRTRYTFFDSGAAANMIRFERRWDFPPNSPVFGAINLRAFTPRLPIGTYGQVIYPNTGGTVTTTGTGGPSLSSNWNGTWVALNSATSNAGMLILRDPGNSEPARIVFDNDGSSASNNSGVSLDKPMLGWQAPIAETEYLCFYDAASWPVDNRSPASLPPGCSPRAVPVNTQLPTVSGPAGSPNPGAQLSASAGSWDHSTGNFGYQWSRCEGDVCVEIAGATSQDYTATDDDLGKSLKVTVTARSTDGEKDSASSSLAGSVSGTAFHNDTATPLAGARVQACRLPAGGCRTATTGAGGGYHIQVPQSGDYELKAFPPSSSDAMPATVQVTVVDETEATAPDLILKDPEPPPPNVGVGGPGSRGTTPGGVPVVHWDVPFTVSVYVSSSASTVDAKLEMPDGEEEEPSDEDFDEDEDSPDDDDGTWEFEFPATNPLHGNGFIHITIIPPTDEDPDGEIIFPIYIDPSGLVHTTDGAVLPGATVTLSRSDFADGPFSVVPNGSDVMSPANRTNPDVSDATGHFGWDVIAGYYKVRAAKAGCHAPGNPAQAFVETAVMEIPPPVTNLDIRLECPSPAGPGGGGNGGGGGGGTVTDTTPPIETLSGKRTQKLGKRVSVTVGCSEACSAAATGTLSVPGASKVYRLGKATKSLPAGGKAQLKLKVSKKARRAAKRALARHRKVKATIKVTVVDAAGNKTFKKRTVKLK